MRGTGSGRMKKRVKSPKKSQKSYRCDVKRGETLVEGEKNVDTRVLVQ